MNVGLVVISNGRAGLLARTMAAIERHVAPRPETTLICDDSGDPAFATWLVRTYPTATVDAHRHLGHGPAVEHAWRLASTMPATWILWMEEDMVLARDVDLAGVAEVIERERLAQMVFRRGPHFAAEVEAGGMIERFDPGLFEDMETAGLQWLRHRLFYSLNPHLTTPAFMADHPWPPVPNSEHHFSRRLFRDPRIRVGLWGARADAPIVEHTGTERTGSGY